MKSYYHPNLVIQNKHHIAFSLLHNKECFLNLYFDNPFLYKNRLIIFNMMVIIISTADTKTKAPVVSIRADQSSISTK